MGNYEIDIQKDEYEVIKVSLDEFKGGTLLNIRDWYRLNTRDEFNPSNKGISIPAQYVPELVKALNNAQEEMSEGGRGG